MLLWAVLGALTAVTLVALLRPLTRRAETEPATHAVDVRLFKAQLDELQADVERGLINEAEAASARTEIERRLLAAIPKAPPPTPAPQGARAVSIAVLVLVPAASLGLYLFLGTPDLPDAPHAAAPAQPGGGQDLEGMRGALEARLAKEPDSLQGWLYLAETDAALGRWPDVHAAMAQALALSDRSGEVLEADGSMLVAEAGGAVTAEAEAIFEETLRKRPDSVRAQYDLGLARAQRSDLKGAIERWQALAAAAPADASWLPKVREAIETAERAEKHAQASAAPAGGPPAEVAAVMSLPPGEREDAIRSMVAGLAQRLEKSPDDLAGWERLGRSYLVLGQPKDAADAYGRAVALAPADVAAALGRAEALRAIEGDAAPVGAATVEAYRRVAALSPEQPEALWILGLAARQQGDAAEATRLWRRLLAQSDLAPDTAAEVRKRLSELPQAK